jgi:uncharacterized protein YndB with AHSA1/START domain
MRKNDEPIVVEQVFQASTETVWDSITKVDQMRQWFFDNIPSFKPEVGFETQFMVRSGDRGFLHMWKVTVVIPKKKITSNWRYEGYQGDSLVTFELSEHDQVTKLRLTTQILEDFPQDIPEFRRESCVQGWEFFIQKNLREFLERRTA